jgi:ribose 5-phosphate isomerase A
MILTPEQIKQAVGQKAATLVEDGMTIGAGTGTTAYWFIHSLGKMVRDGLKCRAVPTSVQTKLLLQENNIPVITLNEVTGLDLVIDGADEIDHQLQLIKGGGGALLQEKIVAFAGKKRITIVDSTKLVQKLGQFALPVEVLPFGYKMVQRYIEKKYAIPTRLREKNQNPFLTDHGNYIIDCDFKVIPNLFEANVFLNNIPGLVDHGLFLDMADEALIGYPSGEIRKIYRPF